MTNPDPLTAMRETAERCQRLRAMLAAVDAQVVEVRELAPRCTRTHAGVSLANAGERE